ncbi:Uncharacterised protein [Phocoenobacter uteri]|uniref:Uncharacterized protein n=2 Tax=Phocoenobacter uteri TaxID=146806 RepID=A0A379DGP1_9PAST|nr:hypothetical protein [Phocoenobacter uteri]SUB59104.1 Uncharacterised protein [Phocoenobacter uteri]SUB76453.1 Uncharacterised protein [Phocoenobacter uteri]
MMSNTLLEIQIKSVRELNGEGITFWGGKTCMDIPKQRSNGYSADLYFDEAKFFQQQLEHWINKNIDKREETTMTATTFKTGDKVYYPDHDCKIHTLERDAMGNRLSIKLDSDQCFNSYVPFTNKGSLDASGIQKIFLATEENHKLLSQLYPNIEFEKPKLRGSELAKKLAKDQYILAWVSPVSDKEARNRTIPDVIKYNNANNRFESEYGSKWEYAVPVRLTKNGTVEITEEVR